MKRIPGLMLAVLLMSGLLLFAAQITVWKVSKSALITFSGKGVDGIFKKFQANISFDEAKLSSSKFIITIDVASLNTGNAVQNKQATGNEWFDAAKYPSIKFSTTSIEKSGTSYQAKGKMEVKGKVKEMTIPFSFKKESGGKAKFTANFIIKRSDFGVGGAIKDISDEIKVNVSAPVQK